MGNILPGVINTENTQNLLYAKKSVSILYYTNTDAHTKTNKPTKTQMLTHTHKHKHTHEKIT